MTFQSDFVLVVRPKGSEEQRRAAKDFYHLAMGEKFLVCHHPSGNFAGTDDDEPLLVGHYKLLSRETSILPRSAASRAKASCRFY